MKSYDVIVLGLGAMGSATAFELARRGRRVLGLEQFALGHDRGSSHGHTRIIRKAYFEHPDYVPLVQRSYTGWYDLEQRTGAHLFTECGCLNVSKAGGAIVPGVRAAAAQHRLPVEELTAAEVRRRFPPFRFDDDYVAVLEKEAGFLYVEKCVLAYLEQARAQGAELRDNEPAVSWQATPRTVTVRTAAGEYTAERLIVTAGSWAGRMLADLGLPLTVRRKVLCWFEAADPALYRRDVFPIYLVETPLGIHYGFPALDPRGPKVSRHDGGDVVADPAQVDRTVGPADEEDCRRFLANHLPGISGPRRDARVCLYTLTPDCHFIIDVHPRHSNVVLAAGFSGHGFKFAPVVGEALADLADRGATTLPIKMFRLERFG